MILGKSANILYFANTKFFTFLDFTVIVKLHYLKVTWNSSLDQIMACTINFRSTIFSITSFAHRISDFVAGNHRKNTKQRSPHRPHICFLEKINRKSSYTLLTLKDPKYETVFFSP